MSTTEGGPPRQGADEPATQRGLRELAEICERGRSSGWPSPDPWQNGDAWQNTYVALAARIVEGRIDVARPLGPLARLAAKRFLISEYRRRRKVTELTDSQLHRFHLGEERPLEEEAESARRGDLLRSALLAQSADGKLSEADLAILTRRYIDDWDAAEVADAMGLTVANVRQICSRRCLLLREALGREGLSVTSPG